MRSALEVARFHLKEAIKHNSAVRYWQMIVKGLKEGGQDNGTRNTDNESRSTRGGSRSSNRARSGSSAKSTGARGHKAHKRKDKGE